MSIKIKINERELQKQLLNEIRRKIISSIPTIQTALSSKLEKVLFQRLISGLPSISPTDLAEIGIPDIQSRMVEIVRAASKSFEIKVQPANLLKISVGIIKADYSDLLSLNEAVFVYSSSRGSGVLQWLQWLLTEGSGTIVQGYDFSPSSSPASRTGGGLMVVGNGWQMPQHLAGTQMDNFLMRALTNIDKDLEVVVKQVLNSSIR